MDIILIIIGLIHIFPRDKILISLLVIFKINFNFLIFFWDMITLIFCFKLNYNTILDYIFL